MIVGHDYGNSHILSPAQKPVLHSRKFPHCRVAAIPYGHVPHSRFVPFALLSYTITMLELRSAVELKAIVIFIVMTYPHATSQYQFHLQGADGES
jgi:hypothetical protein